MRFFPPFQQLQLTDCTLFELSPLPLLVEGEENGEKVEPQNTRIDHRDRRCCCVMTMGRSQVTHRHNQPTIQAIAGRIWAKWCTI